MNLSYISMISILDKVPVSHTHTQTYP